MPIAKDGKYHMSPAAGEKLAEARDKSKKKGNHRLRSIRIEAATNGFTVRHEMESRTTGKGGMTSTDYRDDQHVFRNWKDVLAHLQDHQPEA